MTPEAASASDDPVPSATGGATDSLFPPLMSEDAVSEAKARGALVVGTLSVVSIMKQQALVCVGGGHGEQPAVCIPVRGRRALNRTLHGDVVAVTLPGGASALQLVPPEAAVPGEDDLDSFVESSAGKPAQEDEPGADGQQAGEGPAVVAVVSRESRDLVCCLSAGDLGEAQLSSSDANNRQKAVLAVPMDRKMPKVRIRTRSVKRLAGQRFVVRVDGWQRNSRYPSGHVLSILGSMDDIKAETEAVLVASGIRWEPFCAGAMAELPPVSSAGEWHVPEAEAQRRRDLRGGPQFVCSIDPPGCTDVDDALGVAELPGGGWEVGVHIADVSWFVKQGGLLDGEAAARCTTVYLVDRRLDMLPGLLSENLCSLLAGRDRLAVSVVWTLGPDLEVVGSWFGRTVIRSSHQLTYQQAQRVLDGQPLAPTERLPLRDVEKLRTALGLLSRLSAKHKAGRVARGALELTSSELRFGTREDGRPVTVAAKEEVPVMGVVAEMMIMANAAVASRIAESFPGCSLLRRHPCPQVEDFKHIVSICRAAGLEFDCTSNLAISESIRALERELRTNPSLDPALGRVCRSLLTRTMSEAKYFSTGDCHGPEAMHYGLALEKYTHFTSPIRRYADVVVHRQLMAALAGAPPVLGHRALSGAAGVMNARHRESKLAQKKCSELYLLLLLAQRPQVHRALVYGIREQSQLLVFIEELAIKTSVWLHDQSGAPIPPAEADGASPPDPGLALAMDGEEISIRGPQGDALHRIKCFERVWVELSASPSAAHGPSLQARLLSDKHPAVAAAIISRLKASPASNLPPQRSSGAEGPESAWSDSDDSDAALAGGSGGTHELVLREVAERARQRQRGPFAQSLPGESVESLLRTSGRPSPGPASSGPKAEARLITGLFAAMYPRSEIVPQSADNMAELLELQGKVSRARARLMSCCSPPGSAAWRRREERLKAHEQALSDARRGLLHPRGGSQAAAAQRAAAESSVQHLVE
uniref:DIS3-like exonuclease 1 n=1 Tax=Tetraselmis sp. GSL018 TaxID=582737 RepID=A0A061QID2_9CHLO